MQSNSKLNLSPPAAEGVAIDRAALDRALARARRERAAAYRAWAGIVAGWLRTHVLEPLRRARQRRVDLDTLMRLDDRTLADIGVERSQIRALVWSGVPLRRPAPQPAVRTTASVAQMPTPDPARASAGRQPGDLSQAA